MTDLDVIIRGGMIIDGQRTPRYRGDIGIKDGKVQSIMGVGGLAKKTAKKEIDADGLIVAPGFVDLHTHYDAQVFWDPYCTTSGWHGVTSVVIGNCGFGIAPAKEKDQERTMLALTRNEAVSYDAMSEALAWDWETFPEFMDAIERTPKGINLLTYIPLSPLIAYVMGGFENAKKRRPNRDEMAQIKQLISEAMDAGACGISTQTLGETTIQRDYDGTPNVTDTMDYDDFLEMVSVLKDKGRGVVQVLGSSPEQIELVCKASGANVIHNVLALECDQHGLKTEGSWEAFTDWMEDANQRGLKVSAQMVITGIDYTFSFDDNFSLYDYSQHWCDLTMGTHAEMIQKMQDPARRAAIKKEYDDVAPRDSDSGATAGVQFRTIADNTVVMVDNDELVKYEGMTIGQIAEQENKHPCDVLLDIAVADDLLTTFATPPNQYNRSDMKKLLNKPYTIPGISDGGAHTKFATFGRYPTEYLVDYVREGKMVDLEYAHWHLSAIPAQYAGLHDRGVIRVDSPADLLVYDLDELGWTEAEKAFDMPAGDWRRISKGIGYRYTLVNGEVTFVDGEDTGATPGRLLRHGHA